MHMRKRGLERAGAALALAAVLATPSLPARAADAEIVAVIDQARLVKIPPGTETLIIGNPTIADVTLLKQNNLMVLTPRAFGETNFIALDAKGDPVAQSTIQVVNGSTALVVQRGMARQSYSCAPRCQPTERLGDDDDYLTKVAGQDQAHTTRVSGSTPPTGAGLLSPAR